MTLALSPQQLNEDGKSAFKSGDYGEAARLFQASREGFKQTGDALSEAEAANNISVALLKVGDAQGAWQAAQGTAEIFAAQGDVRRQAMALGNIGAAEEALGRVPEAIASYEQAAELFKQIGEHELRAPVLKSLSALQLRSGKLEAIATMNAGLEESGKTSRSQRILKKMLEVPLKWIFRS